jgi:hypothetical protein
MKSGGEIMMNMINILLIALIMGQTAFAAEKVEF